MDSFSSLVAILVVGLVAMILGIVLPRMQTLPHPYESIPIQQPLATERIQRIQGALNFAKSNEWIHLLQSSSKKVHLLTTDNTRILFRDQVLGAESVAIRPSSSSSSSHDDESNELVMLDKFGYLHRAVKQKPRGTNDNDSNDEDDYQLVVMNGNDTTSSPLYASLSYLGPGRPLGLEFYDADTLIVADSLKGLVQVKVPPRQQHRDDQAKSYNAVSGGGVEISILTNTVKVNVNHDDNGQSTVVSVLNYVNDLDIDHDNDCVYFTSSTRGVVAYNAHTNHYDTMRSFLLDLYSADVSGRLLQYNFKTRTTTLIMDDIWYANGVALSPDKEYVLVVETCGFRVIKRWLTGPKAGQQQDFIANLPGFPDGITQAKKGNGNDDGYWISLVVPLSPILYFIQSMTARHFLSWLQLELLRHVVMLQRRIIPKWACVIHVSPNGEILKIVLDPNGSMVSTVSAVTEHNGKLFMGNLGGNFVSIVDLSK